MNASNTTVERNVRKLALDGFLRAARSGVRLLLS